MNIITVEEMMKLDERFLIDLRSPKEFNLGTIHDAVNLPILDDEERAIVGTIYKQESKEKAKLTGIHHVSAKLEHLVEKVTSYTKHNSNVILFCSRGGYRSGPFVQLLNSLGLQVFQLQGGYKRYRHYVLDYFENHVTKQHHFIVLHGYTGCGKTAMLQELAKKDIPIIDLEKIARNSGSVFGFIGHSSDKMTQKQFDSILMHLLIKYKNKPIFIESESTRIGDVNIPRKMHQQMDQGSHILITASLDQRVEQLINDYCDTFSQIHESLEKAMTDLVKYLGHDHVNHLKKLLTEERYPEIARDLMINYYDPMYRHSIQKYTYDLEITYGTMDEVVDTLSDYFARQMDHHLWKRG